MRFSRAQFGAQLGYFEGIWEVSRRDQNLRKRLWDAGLELAHQTKPEGRSLVPGGGIEPSTHGFSVRCSTD